VQVRASISPSLICSSILVAATALPSSAALDVYSAESTTERFLEERSSGLYLRVENQEWEMITDPHDPALSTLGDGAFHPMRTDLVEEALAVVEPLAGSLSGRVLILPYPRRNNLKSSCEGSLLILSPGILEVAPEHVHATTIHEVGHLFQRTYAAEGSSAWEQYLDLRGLRDARYSETSPHRDRPREIFAEDFRFLFGSALATTSGTIETPDLPLPSQVSGLREWFEELGRRPLPQELEAIQEGAVVPNPFRRGESTEIRFAMSDPQESRASSETSSSAWVIDLSGRRVRQLASAGTPSRFVWDGKSDQALDVSAGVYFVRWLAHPQAEAVRVHLLR
jgi:hypothetical protein